MESLQSGIELHQAGKLAEAERIYRRVLDLEPDNADAMHLLGVISGQSGNLAAAIDWIDRATSIQPSNPAFFFNLANALKDAGNPARAEQAYRSAIAIDQRYAEALGNLGILLQESGRHRESLDCHRRAFDLKPDDPSTLNNLGNALQDLGQPLEAESYYRRAIAHSPEYSDAWVNLGQALRAQRRLPEAEHCFREALRLKPGLGQVHNYLANILRSLGRLEEAEGSYRRALAIDPDNFEAHSNLVFLLNYIPGARPDAIFAEHRNFARRFCTDANLRPHLNVPQPDRTLRVGYVSGDLRDHALAFFIEPVLANHDRKEVAVFCYYNNIRGDAVTARLRTLADHWREISGIDDDAFVNLVRNDGIDVLVDLSGHTGQNRLLAFARKPAPIQASWLGYLNTTGLDAMDYRITDARATPPGLLDALHSELLVRMPDCQWCYRAPLDCPDAGPPPSAASGRITFASFSNPAKISDAAIETWSSLLLRMPTSRLLVIGATVSTIPDEFVAQFIRKGIPREQLEFLGAKPFAEYLRTHRQVDIILDTHPYSGGTTTCHALWMGVPVITLAGETATSRGSASLLHVVGLEELIAASPAEFVEIAADLAEDPQRLARLRAGLRKRLVNSPLMDEPRFTRNVERAYREMWQEWCNTRRT